jgi:hypothetical protein
MAILHSSPVLSEQVVEEDSNLVNVFFVSLMARYVTTGV